MSTVRLQFRFQQLGIFLFIVLALILYGKAPAQDMHTSSEYSLLRAGPRLSPFDPGEPSDTRFIADDAPGLDMKCSFRSEGPLVFDVEVTRYVGPTNPDGTLQDPARLVANGIVAATATLRMPVYDVDYGAVTGPPLDPERVRVLFNGVDIGYLKGLNNTWILNDFTIPIGLVRFPAKGETTGVKNSITIEIDVANIDIEQERRRIAIDWAELSCPVARPVLLIHGLNGSPGVWSETWVPGLGERGIPYETIQVGRVATIQNNSKIIATKVSTMREQYGVDKVNVVAHSKGGLDCRDYINGHNDIERLIMIATPNRGSPLADYGAGVVITCPGTFKEVFKGPGAAQLTTSHMVLYNLFVRENPHTQYITLAGNYRPARHWWEVDGHWRLAGKDDNVVQVSSVQALGYTQDKVLTSRKVDATHSGLPRSDAVFNQLVGYLDRFESVAPSEKPVPATAHHASWHSPSDELQQTSSTIDYLLPGEINIHHIQVGHATQVMFQCIWGEGDLEMVITDPNGTRIDSATATGKDSLAYGFSEIWEEIRVKSYTILLNPLPGEWTLEVAAPATNILPEFYAVGAFLNGADISLDVLTDKGFYHNSDPLTITAIVEENSVPVTDASVSCTMMLPDYSLASIDLFDDGSHGDPAAGDGQHVNSFVNTSQHGNYRILTMASRTGPGAFSREKALLITVAASQSEFNGTFGATGSDTDGDGLFNELIFEIGVSITDDGEYGATGVLTDNTGNVIGNASVTATLAAGSATLLLSFDGFRIFANGVDGPYTLDQLVLVEHHLDDALMADFTPVAATTAPFDHRDFQRPDIYFTGNSSDYGVDSDGNGKFDTLRVEIEVDLLSTDFYQWSANLLDLDGMVVDFVGNSGTLSSGIGTIMLSFDGFKIGGNKVDGPFIVGDLLMFGQQGSNIVETEVATTQAYSYTDFEGPQVCDCHSAGDCNDDGAINSVDAVWLINYALRLDGPPPPTDPNCPLLNRGDWNCDGTINMVDIVKIVNFVYRQPAPGPCDPCAK